MKREHILIFPFMAKGHTVPLLHLAAALAARGLHVTFFTTPANAAFLRRHLPSSVDLLLLPFPHLPPLPPGVESTDQLPTLDLYTAFLRATALLEDPFRRLLLRHLSDSSSPPLCLISDFYHGWTLPLCRRLGIPRLVFHGMSAFSMVISKSLWTHQTLLSEAAGDNSRRFHVPGTPASLLLSHDEVPPTLKNATDPDDPLTQFLNEVGESDVGSWGVLVNSYWEVDRDYVPPLESFYRDGAREWLVGPLSLHGGTPLLGESGSDECLSWLDGREPRSVVYVSFGTQARLPDAALDEVAHGLDQSGRAFLWALRSETWAPPAGLGQEFGARGRIVRGWAPQREILEHAAVGGILSHCGWNSVLESLSAGVPILAWPMIAEQLLNAKHVVDVLGAGIRVGVKVGAENMVDRREVERGVTALMGDSETARSVRERAAELGMAARAAVAEGGSSHQALEELLEKLRELLNDRSAQCAQWSQSVRGAAEEERLLTAGDAIDATRN